MSYYRQPPSRVYGGGAGFTLPPVTPIVKTIMIACTATWVLQYTVPLVAYRFGHVVWDPNALFGLVPSQVMHGWVWQLVTYMFLHSGPSHLLINMLVLYMVGGDLERYWGGARFLRYYLVCGLGAGIFVTIAGLLARPELEAPTIGASGAIYGALLAFGIVFSERIVLFMFVFPMRARTLCWIYFAIAFFFTWGDSGSGISHVAHLGGMVVGYLYLKRIWRFGDFYRDLRFRLRRRKFRVMPPRDDDRWIH